MSFEVRSQLMNLVNNDAVAYGIAFAFVSDDVNKLSVFMNALHAQQGGDIEGRTASATEVAKARWLVMYPELAK